MMVPGAERQLQLGDEERIDERLARRAHDLEERLAKLGAPGIQRPKDLLEFVNNLKHKSVGGQQLEADCMFCGKHLTSTGAVRVVDHFRDQCLLCPKEIKSACDRLREETDRKRKEKAEQNALVAVEQEQTLLAAKAQKIQSSQQGLKVSFGAAEVAVADQSIARFLRPEMRDMRFSRWSSSTTSARRWMVE